MTICVLIVGAVRKADCPDDLPADLRGKKLVYCLLDDGIVGLSQQRQESLDWVLRAVKNHAPEEIVIMAVGDEVAALSHAANTVIGLFWDNCPWSGRLHKMLSIMGDWRIIGQPIAISIKSAKAAPT